MLIALSTLALCLRTCGELRRLRGATHPAFRAQIALDRPDPNLRSALTRLSPYPFPSLLAAAVPGGTTEYGSVQIANDEWSPGA